MKLKRSIKVPALIGLAVGAILALTGCGNGDGADGNGAPYVHYTFQQQLPDGGSVLCVWVKSGYGGGLSCDWVGLHG